MESVIEFLEADDDKWAIDFDKYNDFEQVVHSFGFKTEKKNSIREAETYLVKQIKETLSGTDLIYKDFNKIEDHLAFKYYSSNNIKCKNAFLFVSYIRFILGRLETYSSSIDDWTLANKYLEAYLCVTSNKDYSSYLNLYDERKLISESIIYLNKAGYKTKIKSGYIMLEADSEKRLLLAIDSRFKMLGSRSVDYILNCLSSRYNYDLERYFLRPEPSAIGKYNVDIPWGYLFNVSLNNLIYVKKNRDHEKIFNQCVELSKHYFSIQRLQPFSKFVDINHTHKTILDGIQKNILYDQQFSIDQININHIVKIIDNMINSSLINFIDIDLKLYIDVMKWASYKSDYREPFLFTADEIARDLNCRHLIKDIEKLLLFLSFNQDEINAAYLKPNEIYRRNYFEKPFVRIKNKYLYINPILCNYGFYACLLELIYSYKPDGSLIGDLTEELVGKLLSEKNIKFHSNKEYLVPKEVLGELHIKSQKRECDFIIETKDIIIFIELKRKTLTSDARAGNTLSSIVDLSQSFLHALVQSGYHDYMIRRNNSIQFTDGTVLELSGRSVERVALSLFGFFSIQDGQFVHQVLHSLINAKIDSGNLEKDKEVNKILTDLHNQYKTKIFTDIYFNLSKSNPFFNCRFFSVPQLIEILSNASNNEQFVLELNRTRHLTTGCKDWFMDYQTARKLQNESTN